MIFILRELKLRGLVRRVLIVAPAGLVTQWQMELRTHFNEHFPILYPGPFTPYHHCYPDENVWSKHAQVICPLDSVKPLDSRKGWSQEQLDDYNRWRYADLLTAGWDLVIIDEAHRLAGGTDQVARYKLGQGLAEAAPCMLLLSATPHQGKSDAFVRLMGLLDPATFADAQSVTRERIRPFVIRTEKRKAIDDKGAPLFQPRLTRLLAVAWEARHSRQQALYEAVTEYVREGYNLAVLENKRHLSFLMLLMQRLVVSSTRAIRCTLERRLDVLRNDTALQTTVAETVQDAVFGFEFLSSLSKETLDALHDMEAQAQLDALLSLRESTRRNEVEQVRALLEQACACEQAGQDAKAEALFSWIYQLQIEESDPELKCLLFTEFTATQDMLQEYLGARGFSVTTLNGSMNQEERDRAQKAFRTESRILISTDAGGEGLNLQFCHVVINYDLPWNPMRLEQRIGRVDRIGQKKPVKALNMALEDTVEFRVREVLEEKLTRILDEFGIDKTSDVLDSVQGELFDEVFTSALLRPEELQQAAYATADRFREELVEQRASAAVYSITDEPDCTIVERLRAHPLPHWLERMTVSYLHSLPHPQGKAESTLTGWNFIWPDGQVQANCVFSKDAAHTNAGTQTALVSLEDSRIRALALHLPRMAPGQPLPCVQLHGSSAPCGYWGLFEIRLQRTADLGSLIHIPAQRRVWYSVFTTEDGNLYLPTARHIWDTLQHVDPVIVGSIEQEKAVRAHAMLEKAAETSGKELFESLLHEHTASLQREAERGQNAFAARRRSIERAGLPEVRRHRMTRCAAEEKIWQDELAAEGKAAPELRPLLLMRIEVKSDERTSS